MDDPAGPKGLKRKDPRDINNDSNLPQKRPRNHSVIASTFRAQRRGSAAQVIDLTSDIDHCAICPNILGQGEDGVSSMFAFTICGCVRGST